jgi:predicted nucleotidyltransferase
MKIRIKDNSLRVRLSRSEVELFNEEGYMQAQTDFGSNIFYYAVKRNDDESMSVEFINAHLTLFVPQHLLEKWAATNLVGLEYNLPLDNGSHLHLLLEKDFKCIDAVVTEDQSDYFENPAKSC